ncbi:MAG: sensor histidine kinase [Puniceicoccaceae bacterium]
MRPLRDLLVIPLLLAYMANSPVIAADSELSAEELSNEIRLFCEFAPKTSRDTGYESTSARLVDYLELAATLPDKNDLIQLIFITLSELSLGQGKVKLSYEQLIVAANMARPDSDKNFLIRILEQGVILNILGGQPHDAIGLLDKWDRVGFNNKDLWRQKYLYYKALASYFVDDQDTMRESLDMMARVTDGDVLVPIVKNFWLLESMISCLEGKPERADTFLGEFRGLQGSQQPGGYYNFVMALQAQAQDRPESVVAEYLVSSRLAYDGAGRPGLYPLMLSMIMRYHVLDQRRDEWLSFHREMARYTSQDMEPLIIAFANFSKALPEIGEADESEGDLRKAQKKLLFAENLIAQLQLKADRAVEANFFAEDRTRNSYSNFYITILLLLLVVLLLVMMLRIRTQRLINRRLRESVEKSRIAERAAAHASKLKSEFVSNISHEIKAPMGGLVGMTSILDELIKDPVQRKYLGTIRECSRNLLILLEDLLDMGRIEAGRLEIDEVHFSLSSIIEYCRQMVFHSAYEKGLEFTIEKSDSMPDIFIGDPTRIGQVLINLLNNAIKFTNRGHVLLTVEFEQTGEVKGRLIASVEDTGVGIAEEHLRTVFEPFNQTNRPPGKAETGTGLGLAISKQLVDLMGGELSVESKPNVGSTFTLEMPLAIADAESTIETE